MVEEGGLTLSTLDKLLADPIEFISRLKIVNKKGKLVYLRPTEEQLKIIQLLEHGDTTLILKPRQIGSSTIICAYFFWCAYTSKDPQTFAILSHKLASSKHLLDIHKTFYFNLPAALQKELSVNNTTEFRFQDNGAGIVAASSQDRGGLRSFSVSKLHISEYAFADDPDELKATAIAALNDGQLVIESTANHYNDAMHSEIMKVERGTSDWRYIFFPWFSHANYFKTITAAFQPTDDEEELKTKYNLTNQQIHWRRHQISKLGHDKFSREFPETLEDAYKQIGNSYFTQQDLEKVNVLKVDSSDLVVFESPKKEERYAIGVDVAAGVNKDYSVIFVISKKSYQPVLVYRSNKINPVQLAEKIVDISGNYNDALTLVESNNYGHVVLNEMRHHGFKRCWVDEDGKDWTTTIKTKTMMFENLKSRIRNGFIYNIDNITFSEIRSLQVDDKGHIIIPENLDSHGDNAVAFALATTCLDQVKLSSNEYLPDFLKTRRKERILNSAGIGSNNYRRY